MTEREALEAIRDLPSCYDLLNNAVARAMWEIARKALEDEPAAGSRADKYLLQIATALEGRADVLVAYGESLPEGVKTEAFAEAENLRREARRVRADIAADEPGETP